MMAGPKPSDLPLCPDLQLVLGVCRDLEDMLDGSGSIRVDGKTFSDTIALDSGGPIGGPLEGGQMLVDRTLSGWKNVLIGSSMASLPTEDPKITHGHEGLVISLFDSVVDNVTFGLKLCVVGRFVAF